MPQSFPWFLFRSKLQCTSVSITLVLLSSNLVSNNTHPTHSISLSLSLQLKSQFRLHSFFTSSRSMRIDHWTQQFTLRLLLSLSNDDPSIQPQLKSYFERGKWGRERCWWASEYNTMRRKMIERKKRKIQEMSVNEDGESFKSRKDERKDLMFKWRQAKCSSSLVPQFSNFTLFYLFHSLDYFLLTKFEEKTIYCIR